MNNFREWLSDNLRYIMLVTGLLAVLVGLFFGVRAVSRRINASADVADQNTIQLEANTVNSIAQLTPGTESTASSASSEAAVTSVSEAEPAVSVAEVAFDENAMPETTKLMNDYYEALNKSDASGVLKLADTLSEEKTAEILASKAQYSDVKVYTKAGNTDDTYVVYTSYQQQNEGEAAMPGLSQSFVKRGQDGVYKIIFSELDADTQAFIQKVTEDADVQKLIADVQASLTQAEAEAKAAAEAAVTEAPATPEPTPEVTEEETQEVAEEEAQDVEEETEDETEELTADDETDYDEEAQEETEETYTEETNEETYEEEYTEPEEYTRSGSIVSSCNVRSGPGYDYEVISEISGGNYVTVVGEKESGWWHIRTDYIDGYVGQDFVSVS